MSVEQFLNKELEWKKQNLKIVLLRLMSSKTDFYSSYLIQQKELYGNSLYINHISDDISNIINNCIKCHGNPKSDIIFIGYDSFIELSEDGISFVNKSNQLFEKILDAISLSVNDIIQVNLIKVFLKMIKCIKLKKILDV